MHTGDAGHAGWTAPARHATLEPVSRREPRRSTTAGLYARIYRVVQRVPAGAVATYGQVGRLVGCRARQVGNALSALRDGTPVRWHRVLNASGRISVPGASGVTQRLRLEREGVRFSGRGVVDLATFGWRPRRGRP